MTSIRSACLAALLASALTAQAQTLTLDLLLAETDSFAPVVPDASWIPGTDHYSLVLDGRTGPYVVAVDPAGARAHAFAAADLARALRATGADYPTDTLPEFAWVDATTLRVVLAEHVYHWQLGEAKATVRLRTHADATATAYAKDDALAACVVDADLWIHKSDGSRRRVTWDGRAGDIEYGGAAHRAEFGIDQGLFFDPTGRRLAFYREDLRPITPYPYIDYTKMPAQAVHGRYPMAGQRDSVVTVGVYDRADDSVRFLAHDPDADEYWTNLAFTPDGSKLLVALVNRGQDHVQMVRFDAGTGAREATLFEERDPQWVEPERAPWFVPDASGDFLWMSARDGHRHLYRYARDGRLLAQVTRGAFDVDSVVAGATDPAQVFVQATGVDARQMHLWRAPLDGSAMTCLTHSGYPAAGRHLATANADASAFLVRSDSLHSPGGLRLVDRDGKTLREVTAATTRLQAFTVGERRFFDVPTADGTDLHGVLTLPPDFDATKRYPLLLYVYGGPHSQLVTDTWLRHGVRNLWLEWMATQGCIVATLDNRGTRNRGIEFEQSVFRKLGVLEVDDQVAAVRHLLSLGFVDPTRIGVHGWSYGGYMTLRLMLAAPDLFCCGVAGAPVTDWRGYETGYTERFMDTPLENPEGYSESSTLPLLERLRGRLLLIHGSDDKTVMLSHAMAFLDQAVAKGVLVDQMFYPMQKHGPKGAASTHLYRLMSRFFGEHLGLAAAKPASVPAGQR